MLVSEVLLSLKIMHLLIVPTTSVKVNRFGIFMPLRRAHNIPSYKKITCIFIVVAHLSELFLFLYIHFSQPNHLVFNSYKKKILLIDCLLSGIIVVAKIRETYQSQRCNRITWITGRKWIRIFFFGSLNNHNTQTTKTHCETHWKYWNCIW